MNMLSEGDCDRNEIRNQSFYKFYNVNTLQEFLELYATFYENQICIPSYFGTFYGAEHGDNPEATYELGQKLKAITLSGIIPFDSQATIPYKQKAYLQAYVPNNYIKKITAELNRNNNIVAFWYDLTVKQEGARGMFVTWDDWSENLLLAMNLQVLHESLLLM